MSVPMDIVIHEAKMSHHNSNIGKNYKECKKIVVSVYLNKTSMHLIGAAYANWRL